MENLKRYKVELVGALTHESPRGRKFEKGKSMIITSKEEVAYYKSQPEYNVSRIRDPKEEKQATPKAVKRTPSKAPPPPVDDDEDEDDDEEDEDEDSDEESDEDDDSEEDDEEDEDSEEDSSEATGHYTKSALLALTKNALIELATGEFHLKADESKTKEQLVGGILKAQIAAAKSTK